MAKHSQHTPPKSDPLAGVNFLDATPEENAAGVVHTPTPLTEEERMARGHAQQQAALRGIREERAKALTRPVENQPQAPVLPPLDAALKLSLRPKLYRVTTTTHLPRGASTVTYPQGKILASNHHKIDELINAGVPLVEVEAASRP